MPEIKKSDITKLKKGESAFKKREEGKLSDDQLEGVSGGYWENAGYAAGFWIQCPVCGRSARTDFYTEQDDGQSCDWFVCKCGTSFAVDANGDYYV